MVTMRDIASSVGVSRSTVSLVLNERHGALGIAEETRQRVLKTATDMGYRRNALMSAVITGRNPVLGFLVNRPEYEAPARILAGALEEAERQNYFIQVLPLHNFDELDRRVVERCLELRLAGVIVLYLNDQTLDYLHGELAPHRIPVAVADSSVSQNWGVRADTDDEQAMLLAVRHLKGLGHRRIALITARTLPDGSTFPNHMTAPREAGFRGALRKLRLPLREDYIVDGHFSSDATAEATQNLLQLSEPPTAIIGVRDMEAAHAINAAFRLGIKVPEQLSVMGYGNLEIAGHCIVPLTCVEQPFRELGRIAVRRLIARLQPDTTKLWLDKPQVELLPAQLIERDSTGPVKGETKSNTITHKG